MKDRVQLDWVPLLNYVAVVERGSRVLALLMQRGGKGWGVVAIETTAEGMGEGRKGVELVFDDHAHHLVGMYQGQNAEKAARTEAMKYAKAWVKRKGPAEACPCDEIQPKRSRSRKKAA